MGEIGKDAKKVRGGIQSGGNFPQSGGTGGAIICIRVFGPVSSNVYNDVRDTHRISETSYGKAGSVKGGQDVGYTKGGGSEVISGNLFGNNLHRSKTGGGGTLGGAAADIQCMHKVDDI